MIAKYHRVSTDTQNLERQTTATAEYCANHFQGEEVVSYVDASTGTDTQRDGYQRLMSDVESGEIDRVIVKSVSRVSRSIRDLDRTVERLREHKVSLHIIDEGLTMKPDDDDPFQRAMFRLLGVFAQLEAEMTQKRVKEGIAARQESDDYSHGPAPLGFEKEDGSLVESKRYDRVVTVLEMVARDEMSKRQAADELETSRRTVGRAIDERPDLYGL